MSKKVSIIALVMIVLALGAGLVQLTKAGFISTVAITGNSVSTGDWDN